MVTTEPSEDIIAGSSISLTCMIELSSVVDIPVRVRVHWTGPNGFNYSDNVDSAAGSLNMYSSTAMVHAIRNGIYTCQATISSSSQFIMGHESVTESINITTG
jgi:hypothetical protein